MCQGKATKCLQVLAVFSVSLLAPNQTRAQEALQPSSQRKLAPDFTLGDEKGRSVTLSAYKGRVVLLNFWATWCGGCKTEIPWYIDFDKKYRDKGLTVIGVAMDDEGMKLVAPFAKGKGINYTIVIGNEPLATQYYLGAMPLTLLIDRQGRIAVSHEGVVNRDEFEHDIQQLLK